MQVNKHAKGVLIVAEQLPIVVARLMGQRCGTRKGDYEFAFLYPADLAPETLRNGNRFVVVGTTTAESLWSSMERQKLSHTWWRTAFMSGRQDGRKSRNSRRVSGRGIHRSPRLLPACRNIDDRLSNRELDSRHACTKLGVVGLIQGRKEIPSIAAQP